MYSVSFLSTKRVVWSLMRVVAAIVLLSSCNPLNDQLYGDSHELLAS